MGEPDGAGSISTNATNGADGKGSTGSTNVTWHEHKLQRHERCVTHRGAVLWFTGLSGSGKSSIANEVDGLLLTRYGARTYLLDGDNLRHGLNADLGFSPKDREENIPRVGDVAKLFCDAGIICLTAFISPFQADRQRVRDLLEGVGPFVEVYIEASLQTCEERDPKGLYKKARAGIIKDFTGVSSPYEAPPDPEVVLDSNTRTIPELADELVRWLDENIFLRL